MHPAVEGVVVQIIPVCACTRLAAQAATTVARNTARNGCTGIAKSIATDVGQATISRDWTRPLMSLNAPCAREQSTASHVKPQPQVLESVTTPALAIVAPS